MNTSIDVVATSPLTLVISSSAIAVAVLILVIGRRTVARFNLADFLATFWAWLLYATPPLFFLSYVTLLGSAFSPLGWWPLLLTIVFYGYFSCRGEPSYTGERRWEWLCSRTWIWD